MVGNHDAYQVSPPADIMIGVGTGNMMAYQVFPGFDKGIIMLTRVDLT